jgi:hypothetical protein
VIRAESVSPTDPSRAQRKTECFDLCAQANYFAGRPQIDFRVQRAVARSGSNTPKYFQQLTGRRLA